MPTTDFSAFYDPNLRTSLSFSGPGVDYGSGTGSGLGFNIDDLMAKAFAYKQKGNDEDWYWKQKQAQVNAQAQAAALREANRAQNEAQGAARREQMGGAMDYAALLQNQQGPITYKFTDVPTAARVFGREIPARYAAMAKGAGSSTYNPRYDTDPNADYDQFRTRTERPDTYTGR